MKMILLSYLFLGIIAVGCNKVTSDKTGSNTKYPVMEGTWSVDGPSHAHWIGNNSITPTISPDGVLPGFRTASIDTVFDTVLVEHPVQRGLTIKSDPNMIGRPFTLKINNITYYYTGFTMFFVDSTKYSYDLKNISGGTSITFPDWNNKNGLAPIRFFWGSSYEQGWNYINGILHVEMNVYYTKVAWDTTGLDKIDLALTDTASAVMDSTGKLINVPRRMRVYRFMNIEGLTKVLHQLGVE